MSIQNIKDRIPNKVLANGAIRYGVYDENDNLVRYEYIKREDEPIEEGTPVNKALIDNIQGDLYTQDRYNKLENIAYQTWVEDVPTSGNIFPNSVLSNWTAVDEKTHWVHNSTGAILTASGSYTADEEYPIDVFGGRWQSYPTSSSWIQIELPEAKKITKMKVQALCSSGNIVRGTIVGSKDGSNWTTLYTFSSTSLSSVTEVTLSSTDYYKYYRINVTLNTNARTQIGYWQTTEYYAPKTFTDYYSELSLPLTSYETGKIIGIEGTSYDTVTTFNNPYLNINNLGSKKINGTINSGLRYNLVYNGVAWDILGLKYVTGSFSPSETIKFISLPFTPDLVIIYNRANNSVHVTNFNNDSGQEMVPKILTNRFTYTETSDSTLGGCYIASGGFYDRLRYTNTNGDQTTRYYIAIKF